MRRRLFPLAMLLVFVSSGLSVGGEPPDTKADSQFEQHVRPILVSKCLKCHGAQKQESNLRLDSREAMLKGGDSGPAIVPGQSAESLLIEAIKYESFEMPPTQKLTEAEIRNVERWIDGNATWPKHEQPLREGSVQFTPADREWWAFQPVVKPDVPQSAQDDWSANPIDRFIYHRLERQDVRPAPRADKRTLVRRLYFDLVGMPPTPLEIDEFVNDKSPDAWERLVTKLLDDPRYGEHWARYWLDLVRFAESDGWNQDAYRPHLWRYRDYVVKSFNEDKPYPEFVREQLAGDEIPGDNPEHLVATGFLRLSIYEYNQRDARSHWDDVMNEITDVTGDVFLGMSMACARCHDHKFDPLLQVDYFKLRSFFEPLVWRDDVPLATESQQAAYQEQLAVWERATQDVRGRLDDFLKPHYERKWESTVEKFPLDIQAAFHKPVEQRTSWEHQMAYLVARQFIEEGGGPLKDLKKEDKAKHEALNKELAAFDSIKPDPLPELMTATDFRGAISPTTIPGDPKQTPIDPGFLSVLEDELPNLPELPQSSGRRTALAEWIGRADNPLTTRVIVNRIWLQHFGQGLVATSSDFGKTGEPPTHPELLDWLTATFIEQGWSHKTLHQLILTSSTWRQSAHHPKATEHQMRDPAENLLWRSRIRRLNAEAIRDAMLLASGELQLKVGGPSADAKTPRRALYVKCIRNTPDPFLHAFDAANGLKSVSERNRTTTPIQSLLMLNGTYSLERARKMAERLKGQSFASPEALLKSAFRATWGREPTADELSGALQFVGVSSEQKPPAIDQNKLADFCHVLFNSNEFLYVD